MAMATTAKRKVGVPGVITGSLAEDYRSLERQQGTVRAPARDVALPREKTYVDAIPKPRERARVRTRQYVSPVLTLGGVALVIMTVLLILSHVQMAMLSSSVVSMQNTLSDLKSEQVVPAVSPAGNHQTKDGKKRCDYSWTSDLFYAAVKRLCGTGLWR